MKIKLLVIAFVLAWAIGAASSAQASESIYYINTTDCTPWTDPGCSSVDARGYSGVSTLTCVYTDVLPAGSAVSNVKVDAYVKYICDAQGLEFKWGGTTIGTYATYDCTCSSGHAVSYSLASPSYTVGGTNTVYVDKTGSTWGGIMGGTAVGWSAGKIIKVTVTYSEATAPRPVKVILRGNIKLRRIMLY